MGCMCPGIVLWVVCVWNSAMGCMCPGIVLWVVIGFSSISYLMESFLYLIW